MNINQYANVVAAATVNNGGYSSPDMPGRFVAARSGTESVIALEGEVFNMFVRRLADYMTEHNVDPDTGCIGHTGTYLGTWLDNGMVYIDHSRGFDSRGSCELFARYHDQLAYYDREEGVSIYL